MEGGVEATVRQTETDNCTELKPPQDTQDVNTSLLYYNNTSLHRAQSDRSTKWLHSIQLNKINGRNRVTFCKLLINVHAENQLWVCERERSKHLYFLKCVR